MSKGFTLIELLVVIAIISILSGQLLPALSTAREKGRQANCMNNLKQFSYAIEMYRMDTRYNFPVWLSDLLPGYLGTNPEILRCLTDRSFGSQGHGFAEWGATEEAGWQGCDPGPHGSSYLYMFNPDPAPEEVLVAEPELPLDASWRDYSYHMLNTSSYRGHTPVVRCLWHKNTGQGPVLNIASEHYNVYLSDYYDWGSR